MSRVTRKLEVKTTVGPVMEFTLVATIPTHLLPLCSSALGRNSWEPVVQIVAVVLMGVVFLAVMSFILSWLLVYHTVRTFSISRYHECQGFLLSWVPVFHTVMGVSFLYLHGCQCFILLVLLVFHVIMDVSFHTVMYSGSGRVCGLKTAFSQRITK